MTWIRIQLPIAVVITLLGGALFTLHPKAERSGNQALADTDATTKVIGDVTSTLTKIFAYTPGTTATAEQAAADSLTGKAATDYRRLFAQVKLQAPAQRLALTTRVVRAGVTTLSGDTAHLLVFLDQTSTRNGKPSGSIAAAQLSVTAQLKDGLWRITDLKSR